MSNKNDDIEALLAILNDALSQAYGTKYIVTRNPFFPFSSIPARTPAVFVLENASTPVETDHIQVIYKCSAVVLLRTSVAEEDREELFTLENNLESLVLNSLIAVPKFYVTDNTRQIGQNECYDEIKIEWLHKP